MAMTMNTRRVARAASVRLRRGSTRGAAPAMSAIRPEVKAGPIERRARPANVALASGPSSFFASSFAGFAAKMGEVSERTTAVTKMVMR